MMVPPGCSLTLVFVLLVGAHLFQTGAGVGVKPLTAQLDTHPNTGQSAKPPSTGAKNTPAGRRSLAVATRPEVGSRLPQAGVLFSLTLTRSPDVCAAPKSDHQGQTMGHYWIEPISLSVVGPARGGRPRSEYVIADLRGLMEFCRAPCAGPCLTIFPVHSREAGRRDPAGRTPFHP